MNVGIGLPATIAGVQPEQLLEWARRAERRGFSTLGTIDRLVYGNYEPLIALAAAAAVTERIRLVTSILIAPYRRNGAQLAKEALSVDRLSGGRLVFGVAVGGREDDYEASGADFHRRPLIHTDFRKRAGRRRIHFERDLVCFQLDHRFIDCNGFTRLLQPLGYGRLGNRFAERWNHDLGHSPRPLIFVHSRLSASSTSFACSSRCRCRRPVAGDAASGRPT